MSREAAPPGGGPGHTYNGEANMLTRSKLKIGMLSATALGLVLSVGIDDAAAREAGARPRVPQGNRTVHAERQRTDDGHTSRSVLTRRNGQTATRDAVVVNDREAGRRTRDVTYTGADGQTRTVNEVTTRTENGHTRNAVFTDAQGRTATRDAVVVNDPESGTRSRDVT